MKKLEELKELTSVNLQREFRELEDAVETTIQYASRCDLDLMFTRFGVAHRSANLLRRRALDQYTDGLITLGDLGGILDATDKITFRDLPDEIIRNLKTECSCGSGEIKMSGKMLEIPIERKG